MNQLRGKTSLANQPGSIILALLLLWMVLETPAAAADNAEYLPPIAPQMDRSSTEHGGSNVVSQNVAVKDLLQQALNRHNAGDTAAAERLFRKALAIDPNNPDANFNLGTLAEQNHDWSSALRYYNAAATANPSDPDIKAALAEVKNQMQKMQQGSQTAQPLEKRNQLRAIGQTAAAAYKAGNYDEAINQLQSIEKEQPDDADTQFALGQAYRAKGDKTSALQHFSKAVSLDPQNRLFANALHDTRNAGALRWTPDSQPSSSPAGNAGSKTTAAGQRRQQYKNPSGWVEDDDDETASNQHSPAVGWQAMGTGSQQGNQGAGLQRFTDQGQDQLQGYNAQSARSLGSNGRGTAFGAGAGGLGSGSVFGMIDGSMIDGSMIDGGMMNGGMLNGGMLNGGMLNGGMLNGGMMGMPMGTTYGYSMPAYGYRPVSPYGYPTMSPYGYTQPAYGFGRGIPSGIRRF